MSQAAACTSRNGGYSRKNENICIINKTEYNTLQKAEHTAEYMEEIDNHIERLASFLTIYGFGLKPIDKKQKKIYNNLKNDWVV